MVRLVVADPLRRQVAIDLPARSAVSQAVAARSGRLPGATHEPLLGYKAGVVNVATGILVLLPVFIYLPSKVLDRRPLCFALLSS